MWSEVIVEGNERDRVTAPPVPHPGDQSPAGGGGEGVDLVPGGVVLVMSS